MSEAPFHEGPIAACDIGWKCLSKSPAAARQEATIGIAGKALIAVLAVPLGGCVAGLALGAANMVAQQAQRPGAGNAHLKPAARTACSERASAYGPVHIIDVEQKAVDKIVVWGTVDTAEGRRSFECGFRAAITYFKVRRIKERP